MGAKARRSKGGSSKKRQEKKQNHRAASEQVHCLLHRSFISLVESLFLLHSSVFNQQPLHTSTKDERDSSGLNKTRVP